MPASFYEDQPSDEPRSTDGEDRRSGGDRPFDDGLSADEYRSKHSLVLGVSSLLCVVAAVVCWFISFAVDSAGGARAGSSYEEFLDRDFVTWWNWSWVFVIAAVVLFTGAILADSVNEHSIRLGTLLRPSMADAARPQEVRPDQSVAGDEDGSPPPSGPDDGNDSIR